MKEEDIKEPIYYEDIPLEIVLQPSTFTKRSESGELVDNLGERKIIVISSKYFIELLKREAALHIHKSNSTSSIFIKDTISLPNIDELTRR